MALYDDICFDKVGCAVIDLENKVFCPCSTYVGRYERMSEREFNALSVEQWNPVTFCGSHMMYLLCVSPGKNKWFSSYYKPKMRMIEDLTDPYPGLRYLEDVDGFARPYQHRRIRTLRDEFDEEGQPKKRRKMVPMRPDDEICRVASRADGPDLRKSITFREFAELCCDLAKEEFIV